jgi:hypothetical protein
MSNKRHYICLFQRLSELRLDEISEFLNLIESGLANKFQKWEEWYKIETDCWSDDDKDAFTDHYYDDLAMVRDIAPNMARHAMCVCLSGYFENFMADLCRFLHRHIPVASGPGQILHLDNSKKYLINECTVDRNIFASQQWEFCVRASYVRNAIVHCGGRVPEHLLGTLGWRANIIKQFVNSTDGIYITQTNDIMIENRYLNQVIDNIKQFTKEIFIIIEIRM